MILIVIYHRLLQQINTYTTAYTTSTGVDIEHKGKTNMKWYDSLIQEHKFLLFSCFDY